MLCMALMLVLCAQFVVVAVEGVEHKLGVDHAPLSLAGTVVSQIKTSLPDATDHDHRPGAAHDHHSDEDGEAPDHRHLADAAPGSLLPAAAMIPLSPRLPAKGQMAVLKILCGLSSCTLERPPNSPE